MKPARKLQKLQHPQSLLACLRQFLTPEVWKQALDGLVTLASSDVRRVLRSAADREENEVRRAWIEEAIEQVNEAVVN